MTGYKRDFSKLRHEHEILHMLQRLRPEDIRVTEINRTSDSYRHSTNVKFTVLGRTVFGEGPHEIEMTDERLRGRSMVGMWMDEPEEKQVPYRREPRAEHPNFLKELKKL